MKSRHLSTCHEMTLSKLFRPTPKCFKALWAKVRTVFQSPVECCTAMSPGGPRKLNVMFNTTWLREFLQFYLPLQQLHQIIRILEHDIPSPHNVQNFILFHIVVCMHSFMFLYLIIQNGNRTCRMRELVMPIVRSKRKLRVSLLSPNRFTRCLTFTE